jgi:hypothetical protein
MKIQLLIAFCLPLAAACAEKPDEAPAPAVDATQQPVALSRSASAEDARVFFISPADGDTVNNPIKVVFGTEGMTVVPAGNDTLEPGEHTLQLLLGDHLHIPHDPPLSSARITITVK